MQHHQQQQPEQHPEGRSGAGSKGSGVPGAEGGGAGEDLRGIWETGIREGGKALGPGWVWGGEGARRGEVG